MDRCVEKFERVALAFFVTGNRHLGEAQTSLTRITEFRCHSSGIIALTG